MRVETVVIIQLILAFCQRCSPSMQSFALWVTAISPGKLLTECMDRSRISTTRARLLRDFSENIKEVVSMKGLRLEVLCYYPVVARVASVVFICLLALTSLMFANGCRDSAGGALTINSQTDCQSAGLWGKVKSCILYEVSWKETFGRIEISSPVTISNSVIFLESGNKSESIYYDMNGAPKWKDEFTYNDGKLTECVSYRCINGNCTVASPQWSYINSYDKNGRIHKVEGYDYNDAAQKSSSASWVHVYEYFEDESNVVISSYDSNGALQWKHIDKYNADGKIIESAHYDRNGTIQWSDKFKYDSEGNKIEWARYNSDGSLQWKDKFKYDDNGNEVECANYDYRNKLMWKLIYRYINEEDLEHYDPNGSADIDNRFDRCGNWTVKVTLEEKKKFGGTFLEVKEIEKRTLTYYSQ